MYHLCSSHCCNQYFAEVLELFAEMSKTVDYCLYRYWGIEVYSASECKDFVIIMDAVFCFDIAIRGWQILW